MSRGSIVFFIYYYVKFADFCERLEARQRSTSIPAGLDRSKLERIYRMNQVLDQQERRRELDQAMYHLSRPWFS